MGPLKLLILMHFDAFLCNKNLHSMHFKCVSHTKKYNDLILNHGPWRRFEPCHVLVSWPCSWRYFTLIFIFYIFMKISDSLYSIICLLRGLGNPGSIGNFFSDSSVKRAPDRRVYDDEIPSTSPRATPPHLI